METNQTEECECGHPEGDHIGFYDEIENAEQEGEPDSWACIGNISRPYIQGVYFAISQCGCHEWKPKDAQYYADLDYDARAEKWERSRE